MHIQRSRLAGGKLRGLVGGSCVKGLQKSAETGGAECAVVGVQSVLHRRQRLRQPRRQPTARLQTAQLCKAHIP